MHKIPHKTEQTKAKPIAPTIVTNVGMKNAIRDSPCSRLDITSNMNAKQKSNSKIKRKILTIAEFYNIVKAIPTKEEHKLDSLIAKRYLTPKESQQAKEAVFNILEILSNDLELG